MRDPYLAAIIESVEKGGEPVAISAALHSGAVVSGYVRRSNFFASVTKDEVRRTHEQASFVGKNRVTREIRDGMQVQVERIDSIYASRLDDSSDDADGVTLSDVTMLWSSGDGLRLKTIRLSLDAITAWWVATGDPIKAPKDGNAFWAVGITF
jgi:hypothetical protein